MERTLVIVKPDAVRRQLIGEIVSRIERKQLKIVGIRSMEITKELAERHYEEHKGKPFYEDLVSFITSGMSVVMVVEGREAISVVRTLMGSTDPAAAAPGTIRGDFGLEITENLIHGSDSPGSAAREIGIFFPELA
ncbi:MAG: nucleoside-diphosphate kinase [Acidimicrobiia bacterium]